MTNEQMQAGNAIKANGRVYRIRHLPVDQRPAYQAVSSSSLRSDLAVREAAVRFDVADALADRQRQIAADAPVRCPDCGATAERRPPYGLIFCLDANCVGNPDSEAARIDRRATLDAVGEDDAQDDQGDDDGDL